MRKRSGLIFQPSRRAAVVGAANRVMQRVGLGSPDAFLPLVQIDGALFDDLMAEVTIGETYFFRELAHFTLLRSTIIPEFRARATPAQKFRAWSAACSTGEEAYSIALALREELIPASVVGTDVSRRRLIEARRGVYRPWSFRGVHEHTIERHFAREADTYVLAPDVCRDVDFRFLNLASDCYPAMSTGVWGMDLILCRNVLIYFDRDTIAHVATSLLASLGDHGWLLLGATDPPLREFVKCEVVQTAAGLAYRHVNRPGHSLASAAPVRVSPRLVPVVPMPATRPAPIERVAPPPTDFVGQAYADRDYERTIELVGPRAATPESTPRELVLYIRALANLGHLNDAGRACAAALERHRDVAELHYLHAILIAQAGQSTESARAARRAIYLDRSMIVAHLALGSALVAAGDAASALRAFAASERLLAEMPADAPVPGTDGEPAGRLLELTRVQAKLARREECA